MVRHTWQGEQSEGRHMYVHENGCGRDGGMRARRKETWKRRRKKKKRRMENR